MPEYSIYQIIKSIYDRIVHIMTDMKRICAYISDIMNFSIAEGQPGPQMRFFVNFTWHSKSRMGSLKRCKTQAQIQWFNHLNNAGAHSESLKTYIAFVGPSQALCQAQTGLNRISLVWW